MKHPLARTYAWIAAIVWAIVIFGLSSVPGSDLPPGRYAVAGHFALYLILSALLFAAINAPLRKRALTAVVLASAYGITDEVHQLFVPGRCADPADWLVDTAGALLAATILVLVLQARNTRDA